MESNSSSRPEVIHWNGRLLTYEMQGEAIRAVYLGESAPIEVTPEIEAAIRDDMAHQASKSSFAPAL